MRTSIQPGETAAEPVHLQLLLFQEGLVHGSDLKFTAGRRLYAARYVNHLVGIEIKSRHRVVALWIDWLLLYREALAFRAYLSHAVPLGIAHLVSEYRCPALLLRISDSPLKERAESASIENIVSKHQAGGIFADEIRPYDERLRQAVRGRLHRILEVDPVIRPVTQQAAEGRKVLRSADNEYVTDSGKHQDAYRIVDHWLVINREQLLRNPLCNGIQTGAASAGQYNAFHHKLFYYLQI